MGVYFYTCFCTYVDLPNTVWIMFITLPYACFVLYSSISIVLRKDGMFTANPQYDLTLKKPNHITTKDGTYVCNQICIST